MEARFFIPSRQRRLNRHVRTIQPPPSIVADATGICFTSPDRALNRTAKVRPSLRDEEKETGERDRAWMEIAQEIEKLAQAKAPLR